MDELDLERDPVYEGERGCPACRAEIERLREGWRASGREAGGYLYDLLAAQTEIERLTAALREIADPNGRHSKRATEIASKALAGKETTT